MKHSEFNQSPDLTGKVIFITGGMWLFDSPSIPPRRLDYRNDEGCPMEAMSREIRQYHALSGHYAVPQHLCAFL